VLSHITSFIEQIDELSYGKPIPSGTELVLELSTEENGEICCGYYFVHHETRSLFWLEEFVIDNLLSEIQGLSSAAHLSTRIALYYHTASAHCPIEHEIESQYWYVFNLTW
jgi:hypothetical protein